MRCPKCGKTEDKVIETRENLENEYIRRRRECLKCNNRFTTYEKIIGINPMIIKKDGRREHFDSNKIRGGLYRAIEKRPVSKKTIDSLVSHIENTVSKSDREISSTKIGKMIMEKLKEIDKVAYVRFASVCLEFSSLEEFLSELQTLLKKEEEQNNGQ